MVGKSEEKPSFFKVLINRDFTKRLRLPPSFVRRNGVSEKVKIRAPYSERKWKVKVERMEKNGLLCFSHGWPKFAKEAALQLGEFLVFFLVGKSEFEVVIYETSCCQRLIPPAPTTSTPQLNFNRAHATTSIKTDVNVRGRGRGRGRPRPPTQWSNPLYFEICLKDYQYSRICLPKEFTNAACMKEKRNVRIKYVGNEKNWDEDVVVDHRPQSYRVDLAKGWTQFRKANKLVCGKSYSFEFKPNKNVIHVKEVNY